MLLVMEEVTFQFFAKSLNTSGLRPGQTVGIIGSGGMR